MADPVFGIKFTQDNNEPRPVIPSDLSIIGIIGTAPAADVDVFPLDTPVKVTSTDADALTALGATGTLADALSGINAQLADMEAAATVVIVRVEEGADAAATMANIVGVEATSTGLFAFLSSGPVTGAIPRIIVAPGYTHQIIAPATTNPVVAALPGVLSRMLAHAVVEGPGTSETDILTWRESFTSQRLIPVDLWVRVQEGVSTVTRPGAPRVAGLMAAVDHEHGGHPMHSAANRPIQGIVGLARNPGFSLVDGDTEGQRLLAAGVGIAVRGELGVESAAASSGYVFIGTDTASEDPLWMFYNVSRGRDFIHLGLLKTLRYYLGRNNITGHAVQNVLNTATLWLRDLEADDHILGSRVGFEEDKNSPENLRLGKFRFFFQAEEPPVLRQLDVDSRRYRAALDETLQDIIANLAPGV